VTTVTNKWVQLDFHPGAQESDEKRVRFRNAGLPPRAYFEGIKPAAEHELIARHFELPVEVVRGYHYLEQDTLDDLARWLCAHENKTYGDYAGTDVWMANELALGCPFVSADFVSQLADTVSATRRTYESKAKDRGSLLAR
jgi:hypothetical protein